MSTPDTTPDVEFTSVDLNTGGTTTLFDGTGAADVHAVHLANGGSTAVVQLEVTDGTDTAVLTPGQAGGDSIAYENTVEIPPGKTLQANVTTVEGAAQSNTAAVFRAEQ